MNEALDLCASYQIKGDSNAAGASKLARVVVMVPWINCFEQVLRKFGDARFRQDFIFFFRALQARHDGVVPADAEVIDWPAMNFTVQRVVEHLKTPALVYSDEERRGIERQLPGYAIFLAESGSFAGEILSSVKATPFDSTERTEKLPPRALPLSPEQKEYCKKYRLYRTTTYNLKELKSYERKLEEQTYADVNNANEAAVRNRIKDRVDTLQKDADEQRAALEKELPVLKAKSRWFREGYCL